MRGKVLRIECGGRCLGQRRLRSELLERPLAILVVFDLRNFRSLLEPWQIHVMLRTGHMGSVFVAILALVVAPFTMVLRAGMVLALAWLSPHQGAFVFPPMLRLVVRSHYWWSQDIRSRLRYPVPI